MKRESLFTKLLAMMLCVMMVIGCLPLSALADANDWESGIDIADGAAASTAIEITLTYDEANITGTYEITEQGGKTYYMVWLNGTYDFKVTGEGDFNVELISYDGETVTVNETLAATDGVVSSSVTGNARAGAFYFVVDGEGDFTVSFSLPEGDMNNPAVATLGDNVASVAAGDFDGYYMIYTADYTGTLLVTMPTEGDWAYCVNNMTTYAYGDTQWSDSDPVVNPYSIDVTAGDEIQIMVNTYNPEDPNNSPAGDITVNLAYKPGSCPEYAIFLSEMENTVTNAGTVYYQCKMNGTTMTVAGEGDYTVYYNNEAYTPDEEGKISIPVVCDFFNPFAFSIVGDGDYTINFAYPEGSQANPVVISGCGEFVAAIEAGNSQGYYYTYTAEAAGDLYVEISSDVAGWTYVINNMTSYAYGDTQWSDSDPVANPVKVAVNAGDVLEITVNTYDPADSWNNPAGNVTLKIHASVTTTTVDATCDTDGSVTTVCNVCGETISSEVIPGGHNIEYVAAVVPANCQEEGHDEYWYCAGCDCYFGDAEGSYQINPAWINYTGDHVRPEGSAACAVVTCELCGEDSYGTEACVPEGPACKDSTCVNCGAATIGWGCTYNTGDEEVPTPLCQSGTCIYCGTEYPDGIYQHENGAWAACQDGECSYGCGLTYPATEEHTLDNPCESGYCSVCWSYVEGAHTWTDADCDTPKTCSVCGTTEGEALGHDYTGENGACIRCGEYQVDETLAFYAKAMVLGADIRGIFQVRKIKATSPYESFMVIVEKNGIETELELVATSDKTKYTTYGYALTVPAKEMADVVNAKIIGIKADGTYCVSNPETWSIKEGAIDLMDKYASNTDEKSVNMMYLCANMLNYGAEAQKKFEYNLDNLATAGLSEAYAALIITTTPEMETIAKTDDTGATSTLKNIVFNLDARVQVLPRFTVPKADSKESYSAVITQTHVAPDGTVTVYDTVTIDGSDCLKSGTTFAVYIDYLAANELRDVMTVTLYKNGEAVSATHTFSAESVLKGMLDGGSYPTLIPAMMNFCDCARAYFG